MQPADMDEIMARHYAAEAAHDLEALMATLVDGVEHDVVGHPTPVLHDPAAIRARYAELFADLGDERVEPMRRLYGSDFIVDEAMITARATGMMLGIPGNNRQVTFRLMHVCEFRDGGISRENVWMDVAALMQQLTAPQPAVEQAAAH
ncbi:MAG TPA: ester cyclase [Pseudonocardia sp.]|nr:ester cyclase [Pseudonocardia sp.]